MKNQKPTELSKKKIAYVQNFINWISQQPENIVYNITNKLGEFKMKQKKTEDVTLQLIYKELIGLKDEFREFKTEQQYWNKKQEEFNVEVKDFMVKQEEFNAEIKKDIEAIKTCPTIRKELSNI